MADLAGRAELFPTAILAPMIAPFFAEDAPADRWLIAEASLSGDPCFAHERRSPKPHGVALPRAVGSWRRGAGSVAGSGC